MSPTRRDILKAGVAGAAGLGMASTFAQPLFAGPPKDFVAKRALVVLFLRGGQDALNTLVPHSEGDYYDLRPNIAVPTPDKENGAIDLDGRFGLNPGLAAWKKLWDKKMLAPIVNVGLFHPSRSHFDCQDFIEFGSPGDKSVRSGWLNRYLTATATPGPNTNQFRAVAIQPRLPRSLRGSYPVLAVPNSMLGRGRRAGGDDDVLELFDDIYGKPPSMDKPGMMEKRPDEDGLTENGRTTIATLRKLEEILSYKERGKSVTYPASAGRLGRQLQMAARVLKSGQGVEVVGVDWNGWDHHINEGGGAEGDTIRNMLSQLGYAVQAFFEDMEGMTRSVNLLIMTEFGRTNRENGNFGTDHGKGSNMYLVGGDVAGGKVYGDWHLSKKDRELRVTRDFRDVFQEVMTGHMRLHENKKLFKGFTPKEALGLYTKEG